MKKLIYISRQSEEDLGNIGSDYLLKGNALKILTDYNISKEINLSDIKNCYKLSKVLTKRKDNIIFILGMPRSGTSLVEQIITSHSKVFGGGELPILSKIIKDNFIENEQSIKSDFKEIIQEKFTIDKLKKEYLDYIKHFKSEEKYITDKAPLNFRWIGFIKYILPNSKIIHCKRDPKNNCLSMFKNLFEGGLNFTYDQEDLVKYYIEYKNLIDFWNSKYPDTY